MRYRSSSTLGLVALLAPAVLLGRIPGCGDCREEVVRGRMNGQLAVNGVAHSIALDDRATPNLGSSYPIFRATILNASGASAAEGGIAWTSQTIPGEPSSWMLAIDTPVEQGETLAVRTVRPARTGGIWGVQRQEFFPSGERAVTDLWWNQFLASSVQGTFVVLDDSPLTLRANLLFADADGDTTIRITGDLGFDVILQRAPCD